MSITVHPITVDQDTQEPDYTAQDYRRSVNSLLFPSNGSTFNSLNCVSAASPTHVLTNTGSMVTVVPHSGFMSPFAGEAAYTYTITDVDGANSVTMSAATGRYKIAVVVTDPSAGQGSAPGASLAAFSSSTADSAIPGIVLGEYNNGTVTDTAVRWQNQGVLIASTLTQLNTMAAPNHQQARVNGVEYERKDGKWVPVNTPDMEAVFKMQSATNFKPYANWTTPRIHVRGGYIDIDLNGFKSGVGVDTFAIWQYSSGVKPSADINLGVIGFMRNSDYAKTGTWLTSGAVALVTGVASGDSFVALPRRIRVPNGVTFS